MSPTAGPGFGPEFEMTPDMRDRIRADLKEVSELHPSLERNEVTGQWTGILPDDEQERRVVEVAAEVIATDPLLTCGNCDSSDTLLLPAETEDEPTILECLDCGFMERM